MNRSVIIYALLLSTSLVWAYLTWTNEDELDPDEVVVILDGKKDNLSKIVYDSEKIDVTIEMRKDDLGLYAWADVVPKPGDEPVPEPDPDNPHAPPPPDTEPASFKVGSAGDKVIEGMAPFIAKRRLEGVGDDQLAELGLDPPEATLTIEREGREAKTYELGGNAFGGVNVYVRDPADGKLYLVDAKLISPLQTAKRTLVDRSLFAGAQKDVRRVTISDGNRTVSYDQKNPDDPAAHYWAREGEDTGNPTAAAWIEKALTLSASGYIQEDEDTGELAPVFTLTVDTKDDKSVAIEVERGFSMEGDEAFFAESGHTRGLVRLHSSLAADASADLESVLGDGSGGAAASPE